MKTWSVLVGAGLLGAVAAGCPRTTGSLFGAGAGVCGADFKTTVTGPVVHCEDFSKVAEGNVPAGWEGGAGLLVQASDAATLQGGQPALRATEDRSRFEVTVPWSFGGDYELYTRVKACEGLTISVGELDIAFGWMGEVTLARDLPGASPSRRVTTGKLRDRQEYSKDYRSLTLLRQGDAYKLTVGTQELLLARYENVPDPQRIVFSGTCRFEVGSLRVDAKRRAGAPKLGGARAAAGAPGASGARGAPGATAAPTTTPSASPSAGPTSAPTGSGGPGGAPGPTSLDTPAAFPADPFSDGAKLDASLAAFAKAKPAGTHLETPLKTLGFTTTEIDDVARGALLQAKRFEKNLDADADLEWLVWFEVSVPPEESQDGFGGEPRGETFEFLAWIDGSPGKRAVMGRARHVASPCEGGEGEFALRFERLHASGYDDTIAKWTRRVNCSGTVLRATEGTTAWAIDRGKVETILETSDQASWERLTNKSKAALEPRFAGTGSPREVELVDAKKQVKKRLKFDAATYRYR